MIDYRKSGWSRKDAGTCLLRGGFLFLVISYLFYGKVTAVIFLLPAVWGYLIKKKQEAAKRRKKELAYQFKDGVLGISAALHAGYSMENSFYEALKDLAFLYPSDADICKEFMYIYRQLQRNRTVEELLIEFAERSQVEDIEEFAEVLVTVKRTGGNLLSIIENTTKHIGERIEMEREIETMVAGKRLEARIMTGVPLGILCYMRLFSPGFLDPLYGNVKGIAIMSVFLAAYLASILWAEKIVEISV